MKKLPASYRDPKIFNNKYIIKHQLSAGSFGVVYLAFDKFTREEVAVKLEKEENEDVCTLDREIVILRRLEGVEGVPKLYWCGFEQDYNVIVIQLLNKDLSYYLKIYKIFSLKTGLQIAQQLLLVLQHVHERGVIHRDFKPENIMTLGNAIYLVDFGVSKIYLDQQHRHVPFADRKSFIGTTRYASIAAHLGHELGRKDDIESMFYVIIYLLKGKLPWQNLQNIGDKDRTVAVGEVKQVTDISELCKDLPNEFKLIMNYLKQLEFQSTPDYSLIQALISKAAFSNGITLNNIFEWSEKASSFEPSKINSQIIWAISDNQQTSQLQPLSSSLLKPPELNYRPEGKHLTGTSIQGSLSSMMIKYVPSQIENGSQKKDSKSKRSKKSKRSTKKPPSACVQQQHHSDMENINSNPVISIQIRRHRTIESTWGFQSVMDEYQDDSPKLEQKYSKLQTLPIKRR